MWQKKIRPNPGACDDFKELSKVSHVKSVSKQMFLL